MTFWRFVFVFCLLVCEFHLVSIGDIAAQEQYAEFRQEALDTAKLYYQKWSREILLEHGWLEPGDNLAAIRIGNPYKYYRLNNERVAVCNPSDDIYSVLELVSWRVPVYIGNAPRTTLSYSVKNGKRKFAGIGDFETEITELSSKWPEEEGYSYSFVHGRFGRVVNSGFRFVLLEQNEHLQILPYDENASEIFKVSKGVDGYYPLLELRTVLSRCKESALIDLKRKEENR